MEKIIYDKVLDGESLVKEVLEEHGSVIDDKGKSYWWNTIDKPKDIKSENMNMRELYKTILSFLIK